MHRRLVDGLYENVLTRVLESGVAALVSDAEAHRVRLVDEPGTMRDPLPVDELVERVHRGVRVAAIPGLVSVYLFGSYARHAPHRESDVDVALVLDHAMYRDPAARFDVRVRLATDLQAALGREVDVVVLNDAPPLFGRRIVEDGRRLVCHDAEADLAYTIQVKIRAADVLPWYRRYGRMKLDAIRR